MLSPEGLAELRMGWKRPFEISDTIGAFFSLFRADIWGFSVSGNS